MNLHQTLLNTSFYFNWPSFKNIYIDGSYVLGINQGAKDITFDMDFALLPEHPLASAPTQGDQYYYHRGSMRFVDIDSPQWREKSFSIFKKTRRQSGTAIIMYFGHNPNGYTIYGDFGHLQLSCRTVTVDLNSRSQPDYSIPENNESADDRI